MAKRGQWQVISPAPLRVKSMQNRLETMMRGMGRSIAADFDKTVETWNNKPDFGANPPPVVVTSTQMRVTVVTSNLIYRLIDEGTKENYPIVPVNAKMLRYDSQFTPKTTPRRISSNAGFSGGPSKFSLGVIHPGVKPREFDETIAVKQQKRFEDELKKVMPRVAQASGHVI